MLAYVVPILAGFLSRNYLLAVVFGLLSAYAVVAASYLVSSLGENPAPNLAGITMFAAIQCTIPAIIGAAVGHYFRRRRLARIRPTQQT